MRDVLSRMEPRVGTDELNGSQYARLRDRTALMDGRPQRYATQGTACEGGGMSCRQTSKPPGCLRHEGHTSA